MSDTLKLLKTMTDNFENVITESLGFTIPHSLTFNEALDLLHCIDDPLRTEIKDKLVTRYNSSDTQDLRWIVISSIMRFNLKFGPAYIFSEALNDLFYQAITELSDKVFALTNNPERLPPTRYGYLKSVVCSFAQSFRSYNDVNSNYVNAENYTELGKGHDWCCGDAMTGLSEVVIRTGKEQLRESKENNIINKEIRYINSHHDLIAAKKQFILLARIVSVFDEILETKF